MTRLSGEGGEGAAGLPESHSRLACRRSQPMLEGRVSSSMRQPVVAEDGDVELELSPTSPSP
ncbi:hypothetical protein E2562_000993 [Oryza meyeriana var. granulata]|uniref:Uncharacterized protein n=1 Tax=Oryza meyeriana var. granulata TaxID=110450 RepID=A0A6G1CZ84_9ORYZ|nr:hypothetical protein E2562_000993 [Oryza meyeriana var. granulata]